MLLSLCAFLLAGFPSASLALDATRAVTQYGHDQWNYQNGLQAGSIYSIVQTPQGYLWLRSAGGLVRFDGVHFAKINLKSGDQKIDEAVRAISLGQDRRLLVRSMTRTLYANRDGFAEAIEPIHLPDGLDRVVFESSDHAIWIGSDNSIYRYLNGNLEPIATSTGWVTSIIEDHQGSVWIGASSGLFRIRDNKLSLYSAGFNASTLKAMVPVDESVSSSSKDRMIDGSVLALAEDSSGTLWIGTRNGLYTVSDGKVTAHADGGALKDSAVSCLLYDHDGNLWLGTEGRGLYRRHGDNWTQFTTRQGLSDDSVFSLCEDLEGSLWIGSRIGLDRLRDTPLHTLTSMEGLPNDNVCVFAETQDGSLFAYTAGGGLVRLKEGAISTFTTANGLSGDYAGTLYGARDGSLWAGADRGLCQFKDGKFKTYTNDGRLVGVYISAIFEDDESIIISTSELKYYRFKDGQFLPYNFRLKPSSGTNNYPYAYSVVRDDKETLWFGLSAGLYRLDRGQSPEDAMRTTFRLPVHSLFDDGKGSLWITSPETRGFTRMRKSDGLLIRYADEAGVQLEEISRILCDLQGNVWIGTKRGIMSISRKELDDYAEGRSKKVHPRLFGIVDGMKTEEAAGMTQQPAAWRTKDGKLYFGTRKGLVMIDPEHLSKNTLPPPVFIEEVRADTHSFVNDGPLTIAPGSESFEFHYTALSMLVPERVRFQYQLVGYDSEWIDAGSRRTAYYTRLPAGNYTFRVKACNSDGVWNEKGDSIEVSLLPNFYQTTWFYALGIILIAASAFGLHNLRLRRLRKRELELIAIVDERTRKLRNEVAERTRTEGELQKYKEYLEQLVNERTTALRENYAQLQLESSERRLGEEALRRSEDRYRRFFEENLAGSFIATPQGKLLAYNPSFARIFGLDALPGTDGFDFKAAFLQPEEADDLFRRISIEKNVQDCVLELKRRDGKPLHILANFIASHDDSGVLIEIKGYVLDTTERKKLETQLRQSQKMEAIGQLAGGVAHDFNNLLTAIIGCSQCLLEDRPPHDDVAVLAQEIKAAGFRAAGLTRQLLAFSRKQVLQPKVLDLNEVLFDMEKMLTRLIGEHVNLNLCQAADLGLVKADSGQVEQIILNLSLNARDAMPQGGKLTIETANAQLEETAVRKELGIKPGAYVRLSVIDTGCGMSLEAQTHVFEPFFTTKGVGKGTGLGLSTVYGIVTQSNGHINFTSEAGKGTTFNIYLPRVESAGKDGPEEKAVAATARGKETIMLVEDNELVLNIARKCLKLYGYKVFEASHSAQALEVLQSTADPIDLLLTDVVMPDMNGRELAERVVVLRPGIKVLFMSGYTDDALLRLGGFANMTLLEKPFTPESLAKKVREVLDGKPGA